MSVVVLVAGVVVVTAVDVALPFPSVPVVVTVVDVAAVADKSSTITPDVALYATASSPKVNDSVKLNASPAVLIWYVPFTIVAASRDVAPVPAVKPPMSDVVTVVPLFVVDVVPNSMLLPLTA